MFHLQSSQLGRLGLTLPSEQHQVGLISVEKVG